MFVYVIESVSFPGRYYVGLSENPEERLLAHNEGRSPHTSKYKPWKLNVSILFDSKEKAKSFERYLKSGSGRAFAKSHF